MGRRDQLAKTSSSQGTLLMLLPYYNSAHENVQNRPTPKPDEYPPHEQYVIDVLLNCASGASVPKDRSTVEATPGGVLPCAPGQKGTPLVMPVLLITIE